MSIYVWCMARVCGIYHTYHESLDILAYLWVYMPWYRYIAMYVYPHRYVHSGDTRIYMCLYHDIGEYPYVIHGKGMWHIPPHISWKPCHTGISMSVDGIPWIHAHMSASIVVYAHVNTSMWCVSMRDERIPLVSHVWWCEVNTLCVWCVSQYLCVKSVDKRAVIRDSAHRCSSNPRVGCGQ